MHDPMVVAFTIPSPIPHRMKWREKGPRRWGFDVARRTNTANLGERTYRWWRPAGYTLRLAGRAYGLNDFVTVWHVEPGERDAFTVCKRTSRWKWHVHHWRIQIHLMGKLKRHVLERCIECGRGYPWGYAPISHQWDGPRTRWRDGVVKRNYHHECSGLIAVRRDLATCREAIAQLALLARVALDESDEEFITRLYLPVPRDGSSFERQRMRTEVERALGWSYDDHKIHGYWLVHADGRRFDPYTK